MGRFGDVFGHISHSKHDRDIRKKKDDGEGDQDIVEKSGPSGSITPVTDIISDPVIEECTTYLSNETDNFYYSSDLLAEPLPFRSTVMSSLVGIFVAVGGFLFGYDTGLINSLTDLSWVKKHIAPDHIGFTNKQMSILVSFLSLGTFFGALAAPWIADRYGRKPTIVVSTAIIFSIGNSLQVAAHNLTLLVVGRVISGIGIGIISAVVPLYQAEASQKNLRGAIISTYQWAITIGLLVSSAVSQGTRLRHDASSYQIVIGLQYVWSSFLAVGMIFLPESPRYYVLKDEINKAAKSLSFLRGIPIQDPRLLEELVEIKATYDYEASFGDSTLLDCFKSGENRPKQVLRMFTGIAIQTFQQFSGINFIFYYGVNFFTNSGINKSYLVSFISYAVNVAFNIPGMFFVEYFGRRKLLMVGGTLMTISNFIVAITGTTTSSVIANKVMIAFICTFIASFSASWGGVVWVISAELFPLGVRSKCTAICAAANWLANFICALMTPYIVNTGGETSVIGAKIFFIWGSLNALGVVVVYFTVYETSGLKLEEINELYRNSPNCFASTSWNKKIKERPLTIAHGAAADILNDIEAANAEMNKKSKQHNYSSSHIINSKSNMPVEDIELHATSPLHNSEFNTVVEEGTTYSTMHLRPLASVPHDTTERSYGPVERDFDVKNNYVDLGNGLGLNTYNRGPPSILTDSDDDVDGAEEGGCYSSRNSEGTKYMDSVNVYMAQLMNSTSNISNGTSPSSFTNPPCTNRSTRASLVNSTQNNNISNNSVDNSSAPASIDWGSYLRSSEMSSQHDTSPPE